MSLKSAFDLVVQVLRRVGEQIALLVHCAETAAMLFWALLASGQITMRRVDGWQTLERSPTDLDFAA